MSNDKSHKIWLNKEQNQCLRLQGTSKSENSQIDKREEIIKCCKLLYVSHFKVKHWKINKIPFLSDLLTSPVTPVMVKSAENHLDGGRGRD